MTKLIQVPLMLAGLAITSVSLAAESNFSTSGAYIGAGVGYYRINDDEFLDNDDRLEDNRGAFRAYAGFEAGRILAIEGAYTDFGKTTDSAADMELDGLSVAVLVSVPIIEVVAPYAKLGLMSWERERSFGPLSDSDDGSDAFYGLGARFAVASNADMRIEYERYEIDDTDIDMGSVNLQYRF
ncbi:MAG: porin family protein [Pseudomonadota bacterium]